MDFQNFYKRSAFYLLFIAVLSSISLFAIPEKVSADAQSSTASCVAQSLGIDSALTSITDMVGITSPAVPGGSGLTSGSSPIGPGAIDPTSGVFTVGTGHINPKVTQSTSIDAVTATNMTDFMTSTKADIHQSTNNSNGQKAYQKCTAPLLQSLAKLAALQLIQNITESTVNWINNGFKGPNGQSGPVFIANPGEFLANTADQVVGDVLFNDPSLNFLCAPFQLQVKLALGLSYSQPLYKQINCTLTGALTNINNAAVDFTSNTGWTNWLQISTQPQNNAFGAFLIAKAGIDSQIAAKQASAVEQLRYGQGALSFMQCNKVTYDKDGNKLTSETFTGSSSYQQPKTEASADGSYTKMENCSVKTPGATIVGMLDANTTSNTQIASLDAALSNGIDSIFNALLNQLESQLMSRLKNGILGDNSSANQDLKQGINSLAGQLQADNNGTSASGLPNSLNPLDNYDNSFGQGYGAGFNTTPIVSTTTDLGVNINDPFLSQKTGALSILNSIWNFEASYQNTYGAAINLLTSGRATFENVISCDTKLGDSISYSRALSINANVISNIDRAINYSRTVPQIPWSLPDIGESVSLSNAHVATINTAKNIIINAGTSQAISDEMDIINGTNFNADEPLANIIDNISQWFTSMAVAYNSTQCPINLNSVSTSDTSTGNSSTVTAGSPIYASSTGI